MGTKLRFKISLLTLILLFLKLTLSWSLPEIAEVVSGEIQTQYPDTYTLRIDAQDKTIINYNSFNIRENESVIISLPSEDSQILNRILDRDFSQLLGYLSCNGLFILINPSGIYIGPQATIDAGSLILSTRDISNPDFLNGDYLFQKLSKEQLDGLLINKGLIKIREGGFAALIAGAVENQGTIICPLGTIALAGADKIRLGILGNGLISVAIDQATAETVLDYEGRPITDQIKNTGTLQTDGGVVLIKAEALPGIFEKAINLEGYVRADRLQEKEGKVELISSGKITINAQVSATKIVIGKPEEAIPEAIEMEFGELTAEELVSVAAKSLSIHSLALLTEVYRTGDLSLTQSKLENDLITLEGQDIKVTYLKTNNLTLKADNNINMNPGVIIQANQLKLVARQFGTIETPLTLQANIIHLQRTQGEIEILESLGLGSSIMLRGPPEGFGVIVYNNKEAQLILEAENIIFNGNLTFFNDLTIKGNLTVNSGQIKGVGQNSPPVITIEGKLSFAGGNYVYFGYIDSSENTGYRFTVNLEGDLNISNPNLWLYSQINLVGEADQAINYTQGTIYGTIQINKPSGQVRYGELNLFSLPLHFLPNQGQVPEPGVKFYIHLGNNIIYFTPQYLLYMFNSIVPNQANTLSWTAIKLVFVNANPQSSIIPQFLTGASFNYFLGDDSSKYISELTSYFKIVYPELYPGIDLVYSSKQGKLESEFLVKPGADYENIILHYEGITDLEIDDRWNLIINTAYTQLSEIKPYVYQVKEGKTYELNAEFLLFSSDTYGFKLQDYDPNYTLIIDPSLNYSTYLGGSGEDWAFSIAVDSSGNAYVAGYTKSSDFPTSAGAYDTTYSGGGSDYDAFITKLNSSGNALTYSTFLGGSGLEYGRFIAIDSSGNAYIVVTTSSSDFPTTAGAYDTSYNGGAYDASVTKLNSSGSDLLYSTYLGGSGGDYGRWLAIDSSGNAYVAGYTDSTDFPTTAGAYDTSYNGGTYDAFITKLNSSGNALTYSTFLGGSGLEYGRFIAIDSSGNAYVTGITDSTDFPTTAGAYDTSDNPGGDIFITKLNSSGSALLYSTYLGGSAGDDGRFITIDSSGNAYIVATTSSSDFPTTAGAYDTSYNGGAYDASVTKLNSSGSALIYSTYLGGSGTDDSRSIAVDSSGNAYIAGYTSSSGFPTTIGAYDTTHNGSSDVFVAELNSSGSALIYSTFLGGSGADYGLSLAVDSSGNAYVTGITNSSDFLTTAGSYDTSYNGGTYDGFVAKFGGVTISGTIYTDTTKTTNVGSGVNIGLSVNGGTKIITTTDTGGIFSFPFVEANANDTILIFIDNHTSYEANLISQAQDSSSHITGLELYTNKTVLRHETSGPMTNALLAVADDSLDDDIHFSFSGLAVTFDSGYEVWIDSAKTYAPADNLTLDDIRIKGTLSMDSNSITISGSWNATEGNFTSSGTVTFKDANQSSTITGSNTFYNLTSTTAGKVLISEASTTQTIDGTLTLKGTGNSRLVLKSSQEGQIWKITPKGIIEVDYLEVRDSQNLGLAIYNRNSLFTNCNGWITSFELEKATKATDTIASTIGTRIGIIAQVDYRFDYEFLYEEAKKSIRDPYIIGKDHTVVIIFKGKVIRVSPYDEQGL